MPDPSEWAGNLSAESDPCLQDFDLFSQEMAKVYGDKDRRHVAVITLIQGYPQHPQESVRAYENRLKANWRQVVWNLQKHEEVVYDIAWAGLRFSLKNKVAQMTPTCSRFDTLDEVFDKAAASEVAHVEYKKTPQQEQRQPQQQQRTQPTDSSSIARKRGYRPSITEPADTTSRGQSGQSGSNGHGTSGGGGQSSGLPSVPWVSMEISSNAYFLPANASDADLQTTRRASALNTHEEVTHHGRTRHLLQTWTEDIRYYDKSSSTINSENTHGPLLASGPTGEV